MTNVALAVGGRTRDPAHASARCRRAAEHYVKGGCKYIGPSLVWAGYSSFTAREPRKNGYTHDWLIQVAGYWNKGSQATAKSYLAEAIVCMRDLMHNPNAGAAARGSAAKVLIDYGSKEEDKTEGTRDYGEEQAKWMAQIKHWKRVFLRRGILLGMELSECPAEMWPPDAEQMPRQYRIKELLARLNYLLGKGPRPDGFMEEEEDGEVCTGLQRLEGDPRSETIVDAEIVEE